ncbi:MAG: TolC family protein [Acidobacteriota bacterium]
MSERPVRRVFPSCVLAIAACVGVTSFGASPPPPTQPDYQPPVITEATISLLDAVRMTLGNEPTIKLQTEAALGRKGLAQQATGQFDLSLQGSLSFQLDQRQLGKATMADMQKKRDDIRKDITTNEQQAANYDQQIQQFDTANAHLQDDLLQGNAGGVYFADPVVQAQYELWLRSYGSATPQQQAEIQKQIQDWLDANKVELRTNRDAANAAAKGDRDQLRELGPVPRVERDYQGSLNLGLSKQYRMGATFAPYLNLSGQGYGYAGKPRNSDQGGPGAQDTYQAVVGFTLDVPLGRGAGVESTGAQETASLIDWQASLSSLSHTAAASVYSTSLAYWDLVAAQSRLKTYEENLAIQGKIVDLTKTLIDADQLPRSEENRALAEQAGIQALVEDARRGQHQARVTLARTIGLQVNETANAPLAADTFPSVDEAGVARLPVAALTQEAVDRRFDLQAARQLEKSGKVLWRAAVIDLRPVSNVQVGLSYQGYAESGNPATGIGDALTGRWPGPSATLGYTLDKPFGNNTQKGKLAQQASQYRQQQISAIDLERVIKSGVVYAAGSLAETVRQLARYQESVGYYRQALDDEMEKLRLGSSTLIDTLLTQQRLLNAQLALIGSEQQYARLVTQLRFETGTLVAVQGDERVVSEESLTTLPVAGQ